MRRMTEEGEQDDGEESERGRKERGEGEVEKDEEEEGDGGDRKRGRMVELPRVKYWEDRRVTIYISGEKGGNLKTIC